MYSVYNEIRVFVSAYVWMTGFGNFLYFDKKQDFTLERAVSMWLRINYFPLLLSTFLRVPLELYYVVPLHTTGFFVTMATCYLAVKIQDMPQFKASSYTKWHANVAALVICTLVHVIFYETPMCSILKIFSDEYYFRFTSDRYSALIGIWSGLVWSKFRSYIQWAYNPTLDTEDAQKKKQAMYIQRAAGLALMLGWYAMFGRIQDKYVYNPRHPYVFWMPVAGWLMVRNSSAYLCELHAGAMEWLGRITLETYVLQFHIFMTHNVQHIPILIPGSGADGNIVSKTLNMLVWGSLFLFISFHARQLTVTTQTTVTDLVSLLRNGPPATEQSDGEEMQKMVTNDDLDRKESGISEMEVTGEAGGLNERNGEATMRTTPIKDTA
jgi:N-acetylneuraminate 9-O-acetyltransferase